MATMNPTRRGNMGRGISRRTLAVAVVLMCGVGSLSAVFGETRNPNGVAVIIGNKEYEDELIPDVSFADRDAAAFRQYVIEVLGYAPEKIIEIHNADRRTMERIFGTESGHERRLWSELNPDGGSEVVVFYSGHGVPGLAEGEEEPRGYLLPSDARPEDATRDGYPIDLLYENLGKLWEADSIVVYLDACFSGVSDGGKLLQDASPVYVEAELPAGGKVTVVTASTAKEVASWDRGNEHGFVHPPSAGRAVWTRRQGRRRHGDRRRGKRLSGPLHDAGGAAHLRPQSARDGTGTGWGGTGAGVRGSVCGAAGAGRRECRGEASSGRGACGTCCESARGTARPVAEDEGSERCGEP